MSLVLTLNFLSFFLSVIILFKSHTEKQDLRYRLLQLFSLLLWGTGLYFAYTSEIQLPQAEAVFHLFIQFFCLMSFWINFQVARSGELTIVFSKNLPEKILTNGYYRYVRHPYYSIYLLCYLSAAIFLRSYVLAILFLSIFVLYYIAAKYEEGKFSQSDLKDSYREYKKRTGMFFPWL